jgi:hypothetical protein
MQKQSDSNHGEGNPEAAESFNRAEEQFVNSERGKEKIRRGAEVQPDEESELAAAERAGRQHAKD